MARSKLSRVNETPATNDDGVLKFRRTKLPIKTRLKWTVINLAVILSTTALLGVSYFSAFCPFEHDVWTCVFEEIEHKTPIPIETQRGMDSMIQLDEFENWFQELLHKGWTKGQQVSVYLNGQELISMSGGATPDGNPYTFDTVQPILSAGHILETIGVTKLVDQGLLNFQEPVASYWPEFGKNGKENITVGDMLSHKSFLGPGFHQSPSAEQWNKVEDLVTFLENSEPVIEGISGSSCYRGLYSGLYLSELCRRVDPKQRSLFTFIEEELISPRNEKLVTIGSEILDVPERTKWLGTELQARFHVYSGFFPKQSPIHLTTSGLASVRASMYQAFPHKMFKSPTGVPTESQISASDINNQTSPLRLWPTISLNAMSNAKTLAHLLSDFMNGKIVSQPTLDAVNKQLDRVNDVFFQQRLNYTVGGWVEAADFLSDYRVLNENSKLLSGCTGVVFTYGVGVVLSCPVNTASGLQDLSFAYIANRRHPNPSGEIGRGLDGLFKLLKTLTPDIVEEEATEGLLEDF